MMRILIGLVGVLMALPLAGQSGAAKTEVDPFKALAFLEGGNWEAKTGGDSGVSSVGSYAFKRELGGHVLARHSRTADCKGPAGFDCDHGDLLYVYPEGPALKAIYFDSEGHVIHYDVTEPDATTVVFLSEASTPGPQFRLTYALKGEVMSGKFQMKMPGAGDWRSYLEWSGGRAMKQ